MIKNEYQKQPSEVSYATKSFLKLTGKHLCQSPTLLKKRFWHGCFPVNFKKFLRAPFLQNTSGRLLQE